MKRKEYTVPQATVIRYDFEYHLLDGSPEPDTKSSSTTEEVINPPGTGGPSSGGVIPEARENQGIFIWDDED